MSRSSRRRAIISSRLRAFSIFEDFFTSLSSSWKQIRGSWSTTGGLFSTLTSSSQYPLSTVKMSKSDVTISVSDPGQGVGPALWVTDSGNWWGVVSFQESTSCNCQSCSYSQINSYTCSVSGNLNANASYFVAGNSCCSASAWNSSNCASNGCAAWGQTCNAYGTGCAGNCSSCCRWNSGRNCAGFCGSCCSWYNFCSSASSFCVAPFCATYNSSNQFFFCSSNNCGGFSVDYVYTYAYTSFNQPCTSTVFYSCNCQTCYPQSIRVLRSVSNTVTEMVRWSLGSVIRGIRVITSGSTMTVRPFSDVSLTTQIGSDLTYQASGVQITTDFGIVVAPSSYNQGSTVDSIRIQNN